MFRLVTYALIVTGPAFAVAPAVDPAAVSAALADPTLQTVMAFQLQRNVKRFNYQRLERIHDRELKDFRNRKLVERLAAKAWAEEVSRARAERRWATTRGEGSYFVKPDAERFVGRVIAALLARRRLPKKALDAGIARSVVERLEEKSLARAGM